MPARPDRPRFESFRAFYPYYLSEHGDPRTRVMHFIGTSLVIVVTAVALATRLWLLLLLPLVGYGFAWVGHFVFKKNRPATSDPPFYSLGADFVMLFHILTDRVKLR